jgi:serine protease
VFNDNRNGVGAYVGDHGTAVLGEIIGIDNGKGVVGIAPFVRSVQMVSHYEAASDTALHVADAIVAAITHMTAGDVLLLEVQRGSALLPTETDAVDFDAIRLAVAHGIIVVEAGGNGNNDLDTWTNSGGLTILNRGSVNFSDSGAIMVGAALSSLPHNRAGFSNFGSRVDCYGWGENIVTCGYANRIGGSLGNDGTATRNDDYTSAFSGTSGASPIIVGATLILQGLYKEMTTSVLSPGQMRILLANPATGTAQGPGVAGNIGVMPNLRSIIEDTLNLVPDIYFRDFVGDTGNVPSVGAISASPDIIVRPNPVADPTAEFGEGSGNENSNTLGAKVEFGQDNYVYVRIKNRGGAPATNVSAAIYWSEVATLVTPNMWHFIGNTAPIDVPVGDTLVVSAPLTWSSASLPPAGTHQCFVGILRHPQDPAPPIPSAAGFDFNDFREFIRNNNNVTWRNFNVVNDIDPGDPRAELSFNITGALDKSRHFDLQILNFLPQGAKLWFEVPYALYAFAKIRALDVKVDEQQNRVLLLMPALRQIHLCDINIPQKGKFPCRFIIEGGKGYERGLHYIAIKQLYEKFEVGRITWGLTASRNKRE